MKPFVRKSAESGGELSVRYGQKVATCGCGGQGEAMQEAPKWTEIKRVNEDLNDIARILEPLSLQLPLTAKHLS